MSYMGVHFAVSDSDFEALKSLESDADKIAFVDDIIDPAYEENLGTDYDKAWPLIHSALQQSNPGSDYLERTTTTPASWAILGEEDLALTDAAMVTHVSKPASKKVLLHLEGISPDDVRTRLMNLITLHGCTELSCDEAEYAAEWYPRLVKFYSRAVSAERHVIFLADLI